MYDRIARLLGRDVLDTASAYREVISWCAQEVPHPDWRELASLPVDDDLEALDEWLVELLQNEPPSNEITGYWFGLFNPIDDDDQPVADLYAAGNVYSAASPDWACNPRWFPQGRYAGSRLLNQLYRIAYREGGLENDAEYPLCLAYAGLALRELAPRHHELLRGPLDQRVITFGFDSGDSICLGAVDRRGLVLSRDASLFVPG